MVYARREILDESKTCLLQAAAPGGGEVRFHSQVEVVRVGGWLITERAAWCEAEGAAGRRVPEGLGLDLAERIMGRAGANILTIERSTSRSSAVRRAVAIADAWHGLVELNAPRVWNELVEGGAK